MATATTVTRCVNGFKECLKDLGVTPETKVGIALTGGTDSSALLWLAKRALKNITALTVTPTKKCERERRTEVVVARKVAWRQRVQHHVVEKTSPPHMSVLADLTHKCEELGVKVLLCGHNRDEQLESFFQGFTREQAFLEDFMKYRPSFYHPSNQTVAVLRPLIWCPQNDLSILCSEKGLNSHGKNGCGTSLADTSSYLHRLLQEDSDVLQAAQELQEDMDRFGRDVRRKVHATILENPVNKFYGYFPFNKNLLSLPWAVLWRILARLHFLLTGEFPALTRESIPSLRKNLSHSNRSLVLDFFQLKLIKMSNSDVIVCIGNLNQPKREELKVGESLWWCNRWSISLKHFHPQTTTRSNQMTLRQRKFYVRKFDRLLDYKSVRQGIPMATHLPDLAVLDTVPLIEDDRGEVVAVPHVSYLDRTFRVHVSVDVKLPTLNMVLRTETHR